MKKIFQITIIFTLLCFTSVYASDKDSHLHEKDEHQHSTHNHQHDNWIHELKKGISKQEVEEIAKKEVIRLAENKKINITWINAPISKIGKTHYADSDDWKVAFYNKNIKSNKRQTLYIFVSTKGKIMGANYTGN